MLQFLNTEHKYICIFLDSLTVVSAATFLNKLIFVSQSEVDHEFKTITSFQH